MPLWTWLVPGLSFGLLVIAGAATVGTTLAVMCFVALLGTVIAAVHHAEVIAHRVGEPFGTLVLALAVTVIEASLILSMMIAGGTSTGWVATVLIHKFRVKKGEKKLVGVGICERTQSKEKAS